MNFDELMPKWRRLVAVERDSNGMGSVAYKFGGYNGPHQVKTAGGKTIAVPAQRYERAIDPAGNVVAVIITTNRGDDIDQKYGPAVILDKTEKKFIFIDRVPSDKTVEAYHEDCGKAMLERRAAHAAVEEARASHYKTSFEVLAAANRDALSQSVREGLREFVPALAAAVGSQGDRPGRK